MTKAIDLSSLTPGPEPISVGEEAAENYAVVRQTLKRITEDWREQPTLEQLAKEARLQPIQLQRVFSRWAGLTPKQFLQAITLDHAKALLRDSASVLDASYEVGLSGSSRLHDLFITHEAMTPGDYRARGEGLQIVYGFHPSPFGQVLILATDKGLAGLGFADPGEEQSALEDMCERWPAAIYSHDQDATSSYAQRVFDPDKWCEDQPLNVVMIGTDFEIRVWQTLLKIPMGQATTYSDVAASIGNPKASRAVGSAVGRNPISFVVPCHRVLAKGGQIGGYHWGLTRKRAILGWESGLSGPVLECV
ncbi:MAG: bifunctional helix-turn-helix domain-containing protein/methylated-DNA--[protein]-cysteine S-methyltransferase [Roseibium album]|uniref:methylated-DNA--[protein]-cysteine S-methyltransferase n=1 Tax=Roseibium album TaxID=311410 RepID=UPI000D551B53|nr:bifunctional helix-turn-helix domain-containing protein/methylated-DNA--[protein]-cysteine S-methyltransferase [Roseibium album]MBG6157774.1 AraC family transcriptional regulator of adaptative response/methylated-DNA-[protein]-cysteine methyltransferase [Labrenzia sp. EL_162]MBG6163204.1 AraC family transcriptional regulator of adaptative response/methylated-DNA-[protein]-cysteine methyltransferase [Labrenzia sp. EL_195]MBG6195833.1 AraC family transcriptional regulator of adaptative response